MKLIIAGSRTIPESLAIVDGALFAFLEGITISEVVCGKASGADTAGEMWQAHQHRQEYPFQDQVPKLVEFPADWNTHGKSAGHIRNKQMAEYADALLLIWDGESRGSANMKQNMLKLNKPVYEVILKRIIA